MYEGQPQSVCPHCGKIMLVPGRLRGNPRKRRRFGDNDEKQLTWQETVLKVPFFGLGSRPSTIVFAITMAGAIALMIFGKVKVQQPNVGLSDVQRAKQDLNVMRQALELYRCDVGSYPSTTQSLKALVINPGVEKWNGEYVNLVKPDPWTHLYIYRLTSAVPTLFSMGPDALEGTADDIHPDANALDVLTNFPSFVSQEVAAAKEPKETTNSPPQEPQKPAATPEDTAPPDENKQQNE
jgi:general secretion pathway protein G